MTTESQRWQLALGSDQVEQRALAAENLSYLGEDAACAAVDLVKACADDEVVKDWAVAALEEISRPPVEAKKMLAGLTTAPEPLVAYWAVTLLGRLGREACSEQPALVALLGDDSIDLAVREKAVWALTQLGSVGPEAIPPLEELFESGPPRLARLAERALTRLRTQ